MCGYHWVGLGSVEGTDQCWYYFTKHSNPVTRKRNSLWDPGGTAPLPDRKLWLVWLVIFWGGAASPLRSCVMCSVWLVIIGTSQVLHFIKCYRIFSGLLARGCVHKRKKSSFQPDKKSINISNALKEGSNRLFCKLSANGFYYYLLLLHREKALFFPLAYMRYFLFFSRKQSYLIT